MANLRQLMEEVLADGRIDSQEIERLHRELYADGKIDRAEADFLVELHKRVQRPTGHAWEKFFYQAIKDHVLADGSIDVEETAWLRRMLLEDGRIDDAERKFLKQLQGEAKNVCRDFEALCVECLKEPPPPHTSGGGRSS
jgi:uncharacterized tellurite resistance protein B-like protein